MSEIAPPYLAGLRLDHSEASLIRLLDLKNEGKKLLLDPSVEGDVSNLPIWLVIPEDEEPQLADTFEFLLYSPRYTDPHIHVGHGEVPSVRRCLVGEASVLYWKSTGPEGIVVDKVSQLTIGCYSDHTLCVNGLELNWKMREYRSTRTDFSKGLCKVRLDSDSLMAARFKVNECEQLFHSMLLRLNEGIEEDERVDVSTHPLRVAFANSEQYLMKARADLKQQVISLRADNAQAFHSILGRKSLLQPASPLPWQRLRTRVSLALRDPDDELEFDASGNVCLKDSALSRNTDRFHLPV